MSRLGEQLIVLYLHMILCDIKMSDEEFERMYQEVERWENDPDLRRLKSIINEFRIECVKRRRFTRKNWMIYTMHIYKR